MRKALIIHVGDAAFVTAVDVAGTAIEVRYIGCAGDLDRALELVRCHDGTVDAIALDGIPVRLRLGSAQALHPVGARLLAAASRTPVVDGSGVRSALEPWAVMLVERAHPPMFRGRRILMVPGLNHGGLSRALALRTRDLRYADPVLYFGLPRLPGVGNPATLPRVAKASVRRLTRLSPSELAGTAAAASSFHWAEVLAGDVRTIRRCAPADLAGKTIVVESAGEQDLEDLRRRGADCLITLMPPLEPDRAVARLSAAATEAVLAAARDDPHRSLTEDTYLDMIAEVSWTPAVRHLQAEATGVNKFAFVIHPLHVGQIHASPRFRWTRLLPDKLVESFAAHLPPARVARITGAASPSTGQRVEGQLIALGATPRQMMRRDASFTYRRLVRAARMARRDGARIMGLGAFTSVVGDAGVSVARESPIAVTSGNSLTVVATLEAAKQAAARMGITDLDRGKAMVIGATGSIGSVCARMIAQAIRDVVLVSIEPEKLIDLKRTIQAETPGARVTVATRSAGSVGSCDLIVTATSAFGQRILDITQCKPGAIVCDVARPPDINEEEAMLRPDVLVIESGEVLIPGHVDFHYDIGLPPGVSYACLAETALLAMEGRFESFTLGRQISVERVKEIYGLFKKHDFRLAGLRSLGTYLTDAEIGVKRELAETLRAAPELFESLKRDAARKLARIPMRSKGVRAAPERGPWRQLVHPIEWLRQAP